MERAVSQLPFFCFYLGFLLLFGLLKDGKAGDKADQGGENQVGDEVSRDRSGKRVADHTDQGNDTRSARER